MNQDQERETFEAWAETQGLDMSLATIGPHVGYLDAETDYAWMAWQARATQLPLPSREVVAWRDLSTDECRVIFSEWRHAEETAFGLFARFKNAALCRCDAPALPLSDEQAWKLWTSLPATADMKVALGVFARAIQGAPALPDFTDAYIGAREDLADWKKRALDAEETIRKLHRAFNEENGPTHMGEPVVRDAPALPADKGAEEPSKPVAQVTEVYAGQIVGFEMIEGQYVKTGDFLYAASPQGTALPSRDDVLEEAAKLVEGGRFLHDQAPTARFAKECAAAIRRLQGQQSSPALPPQERLGAEFEQILHDNMPDLYETDGRQSSPAPASREVEEVIRAMMENKGAKSVAEFLSHLKPGVGAPLDTASYGALNTARKSAPASEPNGGTGERSAAIPELTDEFIGGEIERIVDCDGLDVSTSDGIFELVKEMMRLYASHTAPQPDLSTQSTYAPDVSIKEGSVDISQPQGLVHVAEPSLLSDTSLEFARRMFEERCCNRFPNSAIKRNEAGDYADQLVNDLWLGFGEGWIAANSGLDYRKAYRPNEKESIAQPQGQDHVAGKDMP